MKKVSLQGEVVKGEGETCRGEDVCDGACLLDGARPGQGPRKEGASSGEGDGGGHGCLKWKRSFQSRPGRGLLLSEYCRGTGVLAGVKNVVGD